MTLRRHLSAFVAVLFAPAFASAASYDTTNFSTEAPTAELAKKFGDMAEFYRKEKALEWTGREMPQWPRRCPLQVQITQGSAGELPHTDRSIDYCFTDAWTSPDGSAPEYSRF